VQFCDAFLRTTAHYLYPYPYPYNRTKPYPYPIRIRKKLRISANIYPRIHIRAPLVLRLVACGHVCPRTHWLRLGWPARTVGCGAFPIILWTWTIAILKRGREIRVYIIFSARCNIYISRLCYRPMMSVSVCLSVCLWRKCIGAFIANLGF